jgi:ABC-type multidrug transport system fused ATPase/permease subunit
MIAHRLSTIRQADMILLMEDGRVVERGTHDALMAARGKYYDMVGRQRHTTRGEADLEPIAEASF